MSVLASFRDKSVMVSPEATDTLRNVVTDVAILLACVFIAYWENGIHFTRGPVCHGMFAH